MKLKITSKNTLAFGEKSIQFSLPTKGLTLVKGCHLSSSAKTTNSVGKTSLLDVVLWGLYKTIPKNRTKTDMKNDIAEKDCITDIEIENNKGTGRIIRTIAAEEYEIYDVPIVGDCLAFFIDEKDCRGHSDKETQVNIANFIGLDEESFKASVWFKADAKSFAEMTPSEQDKLFIKLLRLEGLERALKITKDLRDTVEDNLTEVEKKISITESNLVEVKNTKDSLENSVKRWKLEKVSKVKRLDNKIINANRQLSSTEEDLVDTDNGLVKLQKQVTEFVTPVGSAEEFEVRIKKFEQKIAEQNVELGKVRGSITRNKRKLKEAQNLKGDSRCEHCNSELTEENLYKYRDELNEKIDTDGNQEEKIEEEIHEEREKLSRVKEKLSALVAAKNDFRELQSKVRRWNDKKQSLEIAVRNLNENLGELHTDKAELEQTEPPQTQETSQLEKRIETLTKQVDCDKLDRDSLIIEKERLDFWVKGFGSQGIRNLLIRSAIPTLNKHAQEFSKILTNNELTVKFCGEKKVGTGKNTEKRNKMSVQATDVFGSDKYSKDSAGGKRRVDLVVSLALYFLTEGRVNLGFLFMDEIFQSVDSRGKELILKLLRGLTEQIPGIIIISNQDDIASEEFDNIWTVYRRGQQSWLEKE